MFRRDTGIDGRYLAFPFILSKDGRLASPDAKTRIAPVLLWPIDLDVKSGGLSASLAFDRVREEVRLNPALEGLLGRKLFERWVAAKDDLLARSTVKIGDVIDAFGSLARPRSRTLGSLPGKDTKVAADSIELAPAAVLFNAEFTGQALAADLRDMRNRPPAGTGLDAALRVNPNQEREISTPMVAESDRYLTADSDPSQDAAVLRSRQAPGLLVEGPPGTGKSQTIVNIVSDAIGRGETVLIVCQKQAALKVVHKRLDAEGLANRSFVVIDTNKDREGIVRALRDQLPTIPSSPDRISTIRRSREEKAARIEVLESELDRNHVALHAIDDRLGLSYRQLLGELVGIESEGGYIGVPSWRQPFAPFDRRRISTLEETCGPLAKLWLDSAFEGSALSALLPFPVDDAVEHSIKESLLDFSNAEINRRRVLSSAPGTIEVDDPNASRSWLDERAPALRDLSPADWEKLAAWLDIFRPNANTSSLGESIIERLNKLSMDVGSAQNVFGEQKRHSDLMALLDIEAREHLSDAKVLAENYAITRIINPSWWFARKRVRALLANLDEGSTRQHIQALYEALQLEVAIRPFAAAIAEVRNQLRLPSLSAPLDLQTISNEIHGLEWSLVTIKNAASAVLDCPQKSGAEQMARLGSAQELGKFQSVIEGALERHAARVRSRESLSKLGEWFGPDLMNACDAHIRAGTSTSPAIQPITNAMPSLSAYQRFRARATTLDAECLNVFALLRRHEAELRRLPGQQIDEVVRKSLKREALLAWKLLMEARSPELIFERQELSAKVRNLAALDAEMRMLNRPLLANGIDRTKLGRQGAWDALTRLRGANAKRLREIVDEGAEIGLMQLRPIWLMNPDVASRMLPLRAGLFDLVIYDEASQMPVEHALPTLFRAKRVVIAGDEKQMPPSNFFSSRIDGDDDQDDDSDNLDDGATEAERTAHEEAWNRREVKDCPDLLQLGRSVLPSTTLQIHYRSKFRELISFSNAAFYKGDLSVPARHPAAEVKRARPFEVIRVDGIYENQTNAVEADRIVALLVHMWADPVREKPSVGVVTFNRKQADLIDEAVEKRATADPSFLRALQRERDRTQNGEDMGFFVKNVENVQGDERDVIIFSTTFGRDKRGTFRRNFGVLGQIGGERRLNVAVTRARDKLIVVTSIPINDVSDWLVNSRPPSRPRDYLQGYLDYVSKVNAGDLEVAQSSLNRHTVRARPRSSDCSETDGFATSVEGFLRQLGYTPTPSPDGDAFGLDFAIEDPRTGQFGIGIECDAPRHDLLHRARAREIWRPAVLTRTIPKVHRVSSREWYENPDIERSRLRDAVREAIG
ncbi:hypothetical protein LMIY3S_00018 [Labrys miyagiensis]